MIPSYDQKTSLLGGPHRWGAQDTDFTKGFTKGISETFIQKL